jgi:hypothetical protein
MRLIGCVSMNWTLSNVDSKAPNFNHHMKRGKEVEQERTNALFATYRACLRVGGHLDIIGVECVENLNIFFPNPADIGGDYGGIQDQLPRM